MVEHPGRASTGASRRLACRPTTTTATSSGTPRPGCTRRCSPSTPSLAAGMNDYRYRRLARRRRPTPARPATRRPLPVGKRAGRHRADPAAGVGEQRGPLRAAHHRGRRPRPVAVLPGHGRPGMAGPVRLAGAVAGGRVLGQPGEPRGRRQLSHRRRDRAGRGESRRQRRGLHQRRGGHHAADRHAGRPRGRGQRTGLVDADRGRAGGARYDAAQGINPEFSGYQGQMVKQADATHARTTRGDTTSSAGLPKPTWTITCRAPTRAARP